MTTQIGSIGFVGSGNMGEAIIGALIQSGIIEPERIIAGDIDQKRLTTLNTTYGICGETDNNQVFSTCDIVILAVKPQVMDKVLASLSEFAQLHPAKSRKLIVSIAAGYPIHKIENYLYAGCDEAQKSILPIIRVMPNTPALVLAGMSGMSGNSYASDDDMAKARTILSAMGKVIVFPEEDLDAVTALSGSGPAYIFYLAESMIDAGIAMGLEPYAAKHLSLTTMRGALKLMDESQETPEALRHKVTSPGGTTEAALKVMTQNTVKENIVEAIKAAAKRSKELSQ